MDQNIIPVDFQYLNPHHSAQDFSPGIDALVERFDYFLHLPEGASICRDYLGKVKATAEEQKVVWEYIVKKENLESISPAELSILEPFLYKFCRYELEWRATLAGGIHELKKLS